MTKIIFPTFTRHLLTGSMFAILWYKTINYVNFNIKSTDRFKATHRLPQQLFIIFHEMVRRAGTISPVMGRYRACCAGLRDHTADDLPDHFIGRRGSDDSFWVSNIIHGNGAYSQPDCVANKDHDTCFFPEYSC